MKKAKRLTAILMILTFMLGSFGLAEASSEYNNGSSNTGGGYTTLENPNPVAF